MNLTFCPFELRFHKLSSHILCQQYTSRSSKSLAKLSFQVTFLSPLSLLTLFSVRKSGTPKIYKETFGEVNKYQKEIFMIEFLTCTRTPFTNGLNPKTCRDQRMCRIRIIIEDFSDGSKIAERFENTSKSHQHVLCHPSEFRLLGVYVIQKHT